MSHLVIGIDGGGTNTRARLADRRGEILGAGTAGTSNPMHHGVAAAQGELFKAIERTFEAAGRPRERVAVLCMGLGGAGRAREQEELRMWAQVEWAERVEVVSDGQIVLAAGTPGNWGAAVIAGTGSFVYGRNRAGETARAGGWGYLIGDEGSGFDLARGALRAATQAADGRAGATSLLAAILEFWGLDAPSGLVTRVYRSGLTHAEIAKLAPLVLAEAERGDAVAWQLIHDAADNLARGVKAVSRALKFGTEPFPLALTGGLLLGAEFYRNKLSDALREYECECAPVELAPEPVLGAVRLAVEIAQGT